MRHFRLLPLLVLILTLPLKAQSEGGTVVMAVQQDPAIPVPFIGPATTANGDVGDQLFLRLAAMGAAFHTTGDQSLVPQLARSWRRINPLTIEFSLDPRAKWHDGVPVTSVDVVFAWDLLRQPGLGVTQAPYELIERVQAVGLGSVRVVFKRPSQEQVYLAGYQLQPLPAHLLRGIKAESLATSEFARHPIGNGPFRFERRIPGQSVELRSDPNFFLGKPGISRLIFRVVGNPATRLALLLSGDTDAMADLPVTGTSEVAAQPDLKTVKVPGNLVMYLLFNSRDPADSARAHPVLNEQSVRQALALALDRNTIATGSFGTGTTVPAAIRSQAWIWIGGTATAPPRDIARATALLDAAGWRDSDGDGIRDRAGKPLRLSIIYPAESATRSAMAVQIEQMWRAVGVDVVLDRIPGASWQQRHFAGHFDVDFAGVNQDPTPASLVQSWSCTAARQVSSSNVGRWCDPEFDRLLAGAESAADPIAAYRSALERMAAWQPAIAIATPLNLVAVHDRYDNAIVRPVRAWTDLWKWRVRPGAALPRDR
jgi:peptide/nickel transport system substrate-binding protein